jgi:hypothetical protein
MMCKSAPSHLYWKLPKSCFFILAVAAFYSPNAASEAFTPRSLRRQEAGLVTSQRRFVPLPMAATEAADQDEVSGPELSLRGGAQSSPFWKKPLFREMIAELIGTFLIVQIGTGSVMSAVFTDSLVGLFQIASVWIIAVTVAICATASISGAHLNPAVSFAFALLRPSKAFGWKKVIPYSAAQLLGAVMASWVNLILYSSSIAAFESTNNIVRASSSGIASAKAFGEYFV